MSYAVKSTEGSAGWTPPAGPDEPNELATSNTELRFVRRNIPLLKELWHLPKFFRNYAEDSLGFQRELGDVFCRRLATPSVYLCHPELARHVFRTNVRNYVKGPDYARLRPLLGDGVFVSEGELWTRQRRLLAPEFRNKEVARFLPLINAEIGRLIAEWQGAIERGEPIDVGASAQQLALHVVGGAMFQHDFSRVAPAIASCIETILTQGTLMMMTMDLLRPWMPTPGNRRARAAERRLNEIVHHLISEGHGSHSYGDCPIAVSGVDVVSRMLVAKDRETGEGMTEQQLRDEVKSLILAGHETTGVAMTWALYMIARHPEVRERLVDEVDALVDGRPLRIEHLDRLDYTRAVLEESMRLYPPVPAVTRTALEDDAFNGIVVRAGESVTIGLYTLHRHRDFWPDPERFDPDRFASGRRDDIHPYAYLPFLRGRRACLGDHFAELESIVTLATLVSRFEFRLVDDEPIGSRPITTLRPARPVMMHVRPRTR